MGSLDLWLLTVFSQWEATARHCKVGGEKSQGVYFPSAPDARKRTDIGCLPLREATTPPAAVLATLHE